MYLPSWFSYCNPATPFILDDTSKTRIGGILYPYVQYGQLIAPLSHLVDDNFQIPLLWKLPPFLTVITQGRAVGFPDYPRLHFSIPYQILPLDSALMSIEFLFLASIPTIVHRLRARKANRPGFPVELNTKI